MNLAGAWMSRRTGIAELKQVVSSEVFLYFWLCVQAAFVQRLKPQQFTLFRTMIAGVLLMAAFLIHDQPRFVAVAALFAISGSILLLIDLFRMRRILEDHYNSVEPYGLSLNGVWLFFLGPIYLQYHLLKIAMWKNKQS